jgi:hypothetical protein
LLYVYKEESAGLVVCCSGSGRYCAIVSAIIFSGGNVMSWQRILICAAVVWLACWPAGAAQAASVSGRASTVVEWFDDANEDTAVPLYQYLQLNVRDMGGKGYTFSGYGRLGDDLKNEVDAKSRLYYAFIEKKGFLTEALDMRLGRQFISVTAGASLMDGLKLDYRFAKRYKLSLFGGGDVTYYEGYNAQDVIVGGELSGRFLDGLDLGLSYVQKLDSGNMSHELFGLDVEWDIRKALYLYSETQYDYLSDRVSYFLGGAKYHLSEDWTARVEYLYSLPVFSASSIFSVFAVEEYEEVMGELTYNSAPGWRTFGRYTREIYQEFADANVYEAGVEKIRTERFAGYLTGVYRDDADGQDLKGFKIYGSCLFNRYLQAGIGANVDVLERQLNFFNDESDADETTAKRYWADATVFVNKKVNVQAKVERVESDLWDHYNRGRVRLNILF